MRREYLLLLLLFNTALEILTREVNQENNKKFAIEKEVQLLLLADNVILFLETPGEFSKDLKLTVSAE